MQALLIMASAVGLMATSATRPPHWSYQGHEGPEHWGTLSPEFATCGTGHTQSPIDHGGFDAKQAVAVSTDYHAGPLMLLNNGHTVQANFVTGSTLSSGGHSYGLVQVHFHTPSEEAFNGEHYPMVAHFVHKDTAGKLAVLGVLFEEGAPNAELAKLIAHAPKSETPSHEIANAEFNPAALLPHDLHVYRYAGSLTTPPCTEGVNWHVALTPVTASKAQIEEIHAIIGNNARPVQPLNGRQLAAD